jgi:hypothetical protein
LSLTAPTFFTNASQNQPVGRSGQRKLISAISYPEQFHTRRRDFLVIRRILLKAENGYRMRNASQDYEAQF